MNRDGSVGVIAPHEGGAWLQSGTVLLQAFGSIGLRQWIWATGLALIVLVSYVLSIANAVFGIPPVQTSWRFPEITTTIAVHLMAAYSVLLALTVVNLRGKSTRRHYAFAAAAAVSATVSLEMILIALLPSPSGWNFVPDGATWISRVAWSLTNWSLTVAMVVAVYAWVNRARDARFALDLVERERAMKRREVLASQLAALQAQVEPRFLLSVLAQAEALYDRDAASGDRMLDGLIAYLRAALPQLRGDGSDLERESRLCEAYLRLLQLRMGGRLQFAIAIPAGLAHRVFPPMLLLPLIDYAVRIGLEPLPFGGSIEVCAGAHDMRLRVEVSHTGLQPGAEDGTSALLETLQRRLQGLYGAAASLELRSRTTRGVIATIEVPLEDTRDRR
jgi:hypothetical protein